MRTLNTCWEGGVVAMQELERRRQETQETEQDNSTEENVCSEKEK